MEMEPDKCTVCGGTDSKLIDGFYYCIECGTQNTNVRETIIEERVLADGTFAQTSKKRIVQIKEDGIEMSGEWYKWHAYNFIINGLANDLLKLGAKPTFKIKLLWIWTRYIKKYQNKAELSMNKTSQGDKNQTAFPTFIFEDDSDQEQDTTQDDTTNKKNKWFIKHGTKRDTNFLSIGVIVAMLYLALNLDESDIQLSHLYRFIQEKHLDVLNINRFVPEDINTKKIPEWKNFLYSKLCTQHQIRVLAMSLLRNLDLGTPKVPDLRKIIDNFLTELCLPNDIKPLIYSLMQYKKCDFLDMDNISKNYLLRLPDYEGTIMTYILVALKMCFGLDSDYEIKLCNVVDRMNMENNLPQSYKMGNYSEPSDRLFSFKEWCSYLSFRKVMLGKYNLRIAERYCLNVDDYVYFEHMEERPKNNEKLSDKITMDVISRIPQERNLGVIPKNRFTPSLTPLSEYTDIIIEYCQDPEIKLKLAEDFKRYSLKYACKDLELLDSNFENIVKGVSTEKKLVSKIISGIYVTNKTKMNMVYVKNCENRNWMKTNPPTMEHVIHAQEKKDDANDRESDHGYDSEITAKEKDFDNVNKSLTDLSIIEENSRDYLNTSREKEITHENNSENIVKHINNSCDNDSTNMTDGRDINTSEDNGIETIQKNKCPENLIGDNMPVPIDNVVENSEKNANKECVQEILDNYEHLENNLKEKDVESSIAEEVSNHSMIDENTKDSNNSEETPSEKNMQKEKETVQLCKEKQLDITGDQSLCETSILNKGSENYEEKYRTKIIEEEDTEKNIFDDDFEDITFKEECEKNIVGNNQPDCDDNEYNNQIQNDEIINDDFDRRSDTSDVILPTFNPETFDRNRTIKELILHACKKYKIPLPAEYKTSEPRKRKEGMSDNVQVVRSKRAKYEGKASAKDLLMNYYNYLQSDFVSKVQQEMSVAVHNAELNEQNLQQSCDLSSINLQISVVDRNSVPESGLDTPIARSEVGSTVGPINDNLNTTNMTDINHETGEIDINLENSLFEDDKKMQLDDVIPKCDPIFNENLYETDQLYMEVKDDCDDFEPAVDPQIDEIIMRKIEQCKNSTEFEKLRAEAIEINKKKNEDSDSADEVPISVLKEEQIFIEEMYQQEAKFDRLIQKEDIPEYKYWIRHYDRYFMGKSVDMHKKFDEELKENTPSNFYFVLQECSSVLNCSNFYLYKSLQSFEESLSKSKNLKNNIVDADDTKCDISEDVLNEICEKT